MKSKTIKAKAWVVILSERVFPGNVYNTEVMARRYATMYSGDYYPCTITVKLPVEKGSKCKK
jgi:hypothetical protein